MQQPQNIWAMTEYLRSLENNQLRNGWEEYKKTEMENKLSWKK